MVKAELTGSTIKPLPTHRPWSGGSNSAPKLVMALSRLLTPLNPSSNVPVDDTWEEELTCGAWLGALVGCWKRRAPLGNVEPEAVASPVNVRLLGFTTAKGESVPVVAPKDFTLAA